MELNKSVRFVVSERDRALLQTLAGQDGDASMSATLRRLIRAEAQRRGLLGDEARRRGQMVDEAQRAGVAQG
jgi:GAF domain-containing protein